MSWRAMLLSTGPGWVERTGTIHPTLLVSDADAPTASPTGAMTVGYTLYSGATGDTGGSIATGTATTSGTVEFNASIALSSPLDAAGRYRARWVGNGDLDDIDVWQDVRATRHAAGMRRPPVTTLDLLQRFPALSDYPNGWTSWEPIIGAAWRVVSRRVFDESPPGEIWAPDMYAAPCLNLAVAMIHEQAATYGGADSLVISDRFLAKYEAFWARTVTVTDADANGTPDAVSHTQGPSSAPGPTT